jgi:TonB family protein
MPRNISAYAYAIAFSLLLAASTSAQEKSVIVPVVAAPATNDRAQDLLSGPVRRVRVERAKIHLKDGKLVEAPRTAETVVTYDSSGKRIDTQPSPSDRTSLGAKETYKHDEKGNVVESMLWSDDGSLLSKEVFAYEFDELGNWRRRTRSIAVYENGNISYEPVEVTYRTITYYFDQSVARLANPTDEDLSKASSVSNGNLLAHANPPTSKLADASEAPKSTAVIASDDSVNTKEENLPVVHLSEEALRKALVELPEADYPTEAKSANLEGKVEVQVTINEKGEVTNARAISGNPLLTDAATKAVSKARFAANRLTNQPAHVVGLLTYQFSLEQKRLSVLETPDTERLVVADVRGSEYRVSRSVSAVESAATSSPNETAPTTSPVLAEKSSLLAREPVPGTPFEKGIASLNAANFEAAVGFFREMVQRDPNDAAAYYKLGLAYSSMGKHQETIGAYKKAIRLKRGLASADAFYRLGSAYVATEDYREAVEPLKQAIYIIRAQVLGPDPSRDSSRDPSEAEVRYALGLCYYGAASFRNATNEFQEALRLKPDFSNARYGLGLSLLATGDKRSAEKEEAALRKLKSPLADKLAGLLLSPVVRRNRVF